MATRKPTPSSLQEEETRTIPVAMLEEICACLAFHAHESSIVNTLCDPQDKQLEHQVELAKALIRFAGFDFDTLYPPEKRTVVY